MFEVTVQAAWSQQDTHTGRGARRPWQAPLWASGTSMPNQRRRSRQALQGSAPLGNPACILVARCMPRAAWHSRPLCGPWVGSPLPPLKEPRQEPLSIPAGPSVLMCPRVSVPRVCRELEKWPDRARPAVLVVSCAGGIINQPVSCQGSVHLMWRVFGPI